MPINNVVKLIKAIDSSKDLRENLNNFNKPVEVMEYLSNNGYKFTLDEFEDAIQMLHVHCQTEEEALLLMDKAMWLRFLLKQGK